MTLINFPDNINNNPLGLPVVEVGHGIANNFRTHIEINKHLRGHPNLLNPILQHEFSHTNKPVSMEDFNIDFTLPNRLNNVELLKFMFKHPKSFTQLAPFYWSRKKGFVYDINLMVMYLIMFGVVFTTIYFGGKYL